MLKKFIPFRLNLVTAPAVEPVTLQEIKNMLRIDGSDEDTFLTSLIAPARLACEQYTKRAFITQEWQMFYDFEPFLNYMYGYNISDNIRSYNSMGYYCNQKSYNNSFEIPKSPLISVTHIKTYSNDDTATTFSTSNYQVSAYGGNSPQLGRITLRDGASFPDFTRNADGLEVQFSAGYGANASDVPELIRQAILTFIGYLYEHRGECDTGSMPNTTKVMLQQFRILDI